MSDAGNKSLPATAEALPEVPTSGRARSRPGRANRVARPHRRAPDGFPAGQHASSFGGTGLPESSRACVTSYDMVATGDHGVDPIQRSGTRSE